MKEALSMWEERERRRFEIPEVVDEAEASLAPGEGREIARRSMRSRAKGMPAGFSAPPVGSRTAGVRSRVQFNGTRQRP